MRDIWNQFRSDCRNEDIKEIYRIVRCKKILSLNEINHARDLLPFRNCVVDLNTGEITDHDPDNYFLFCFDWNYNPEAKSVRFLSALTEMLPEEIARNRLLHYLTYCLTARIDLQLAQIWIGPQGCGKSKLQEEFVKMLNEFAYRIHLNSLCTDIRARADTFGRRVIWGSEIGGFKIQKEPINKLKSIITDGIMDGERKYEHPMNFENTAKLLYSTNDTPIPMGADDAFWIRWDFIQFTKIYRGTEQQDKKFWENLFAEEKEGIVNYLISLIPNLEKVLTTPDPKKVKEIWLTYCSNTSKFLTACCNRDKETHCACTYLYRQYVMWCNNERDLSYRLCYCT